jgi:hypothetical protein
VDYFNPADYGPAIDSWPDPQLFESFKTAIWIVAKWEDQNGSDVFCADLQSRKVFSLGYRPY